MTKHSHDWERRSTAYVGTKRYDTYRCTVCGMIETEEAK